MTDAQTCLVVLEVGSANDDVAWIDNLVRLERLRHESMQLLWWLHNNSAVTKREHGLFLHPDVLDHFGPKYCESRLHLPMVRHVP